MKILDNQHVAELKRYLKLDPSKKGGATTETQSSREVVSGQDNVNLSGRAKELNETMQAVESTPDVREEKVEEVKGKVESGTYDVKGDAIADKMIKTSVLDKIV